MWLGACGGGDDIVGDPTVEDDVVEAVDPLVQAIADDVVTDPGSPLEGDRESADCFAVAIVDAIGGDRLVELGFSVGSVPDELLTDWTADEVDVIVERFEGCVDVVGLTETTVAEVVGNEGVECVAQQVGGQSLKQSNTCLGQVRWIDVGCH